MATSSYALAVNHNEAVKLISTNGVGVTYVFEGEPGTGKSSMLKTLKQALGDTYDYIYVDVPIKDIPDIALSMPDHETQTTKAFINSLWLGENKDKPKVVMLDEVFKGMSDYVKLMMNRLLLERMVGDYKLPEGSIVFGTTNFQTDGVGDKTNGHTNSRVVRVPMRKPNKDEWAIWANNNGIHPFVATWAAQNPQVFDSYKDHEFDSNMHKSGQGVFHYIFHPQHNSTTYVAPRTLELASRQMHNIDEVGIELTRRALVGTIGMKAAMDMMEMVVIGNDLPHPDDIEASPETARIPKSPVAQMMMVYKSIQFVNKDNLDQYTTYFERFPTEMTATWVRTSLAVEKLRGFFSSHQKVRKFIIDNAWVL